MAKNIRSSDAARSVNRIQRAIIDECARQEEACLYTSTSLYIWLRRVRLQRKFFIVAPIVLGALAGYSVLRNCLPDWGIALLALVASLFPALADALKFETHVDEIARLAADFKSLQDGFRQLRTITATSNPIAAESELARLMDHLNIARSSSVTAPEWTFEKAKAKIKLGDYSFNVDK